MGAAGTRRAGAECRCMEGKPAPNGGACSLLLVTLNEGGLRLSRGRVAAAVDALARSLGPGLSAVAVARQEALEVTGASWDAALAAHGFRHMVAGATLNTETRLTLYAREADEFRLLADFCAQRPGARRGDPKGAAGAVLKHRSGDLLGLASMHLDGNLVAAEKLSVPPAAVSQACAAACAAAGRKLDHVLLFGDFNCTIEPRAGMGGDSALRQRVSDLIGQEMRDLASSEADNAVAQLSDETKALMLKALAAPDGREALMALDGCPGTIAVDSGTLGAEVETRTVCDITPLRLVGMPSACFPTYRLCNVGGQGEQLLGTAAKVGTADASNAGVFRLTPMLEVSEKCIHACYFNDGNKDGNKAGALKKRKDMCRLNLGWLDRLYIAASKAAGSSVEAVQSDPFFLVADTGDAVDHLLMSWRVTIVGSGTLP